MTPCVIFFPHACVPIKAKLLAAFIIIRIDVYHTNTFTIFIYFATIIRVARRSERAMFNIIFFLINVVIVTSGCSSVLMNIKLAPTTKNAERYNK